MKKNQGKHNQHKEEKYRKGTMELIKLVITYPKLKIWEESPIINLQKGLQQGGICSPMLFILVADEITKESQRCESEKKD